MKGCVYTLTRTSHPLATSRSSSSISLNTHKQQADVLDTIKQLGYAKCTLVGHDWGAAIAWKVTQQVCCGIDDGIVYYSLCIK